MQHVTRLILAALILASASARAEDTDLVVQHQGFLVKADETAVTESTTLKFSLYDRETAGNEKWSDTWTLSPLAGRYSVQLGKTEGGHKALHAADLAGERWLVVTIGTSELLPRLKFSAVPLAGHAGSADKALDSDKFGGLTPDKFALKSDVPETALDSEKLGGLAADKYALKTDVPDTALDSDKLGGVAASAYARKTDIPAVAADSQKLNGLEASAYATASHNHDDLYLKKAGGTVDALTVTGALSAASANVGGAITAASATVSGKVIAQQFTSPPVTFNGTHVYSNGPKGPIALVKHPNVILTESGNAGEYDGTQTSQPACVYKEGATWYLYHGGYDGSIWGGLGVATASDPTGPFTRVGNLPILPTSSSTSQGQDLSDFYWCSIVKDGSTYYMYYAGYATSARGGDNKWRLFLATSSNLTSGWTKKGLVLDVRAGQNAFDRSHSNAPSVLLENGKIQLMYAGYNDQWDSDAYVTPGWQNGAGGTAWTIGMAISADADRKLFTPTSLFPVMRSSWPKPYIWNNTYTAGQRLSVGYSPWDRWSIFPGSVMKIGDTYLMLYQGDDGYFTQIGAAQSYDGQTWTRQGFPALHTESPGLPGGAHVYAPRGIIDGNTLYVYYGTHDYTLGGATNGKGRIRLATLRF